jgi:glycogen debranching enzyme
MEDVIEVDKQYYILASAPRTDGGSRVLKHADTFAVFDQFGNIQPVGMGEEGLFHEGTRFLSRLSLLVNGRRPLLLSSTVREDNVLLTVDLTNPDIESEGEVALPRDTIHIFRSTFLTGGVCHTRFRVRNYSVRTVTLALALSFEADYADIFEVRGARRERRGERLTSQANHDTVVMSYRGLDDVTRRTTLAFDPAPRELAPNRALYVEELAPAAEQTYCLCVVCDLGCKPHSDPFAAALSHVTARNNQDRAADAWVVTGNELFNDWLNRSVSDLHMMATDTPYGSYPYAGVPWFSTVFGRDGIITAMEYLWINPCFAHGVLGYLAANQATEVAPERDAEPGKILHETRGGEMAALGEIPFGRYYGSVDSTPLFVMLAGAYYRRTADLDFIQSIWPNIGRALDWIDDWADSDGDGLFDYARRSDTGLVTQGWKDSVDSVFHADGRLANPPVALCEMQGYVYAAWQAAADLSELLGEAARADDLRQRAVTLRERFDERYWLDDLGVYALAVDGDKQICRVKTSNAGHALFTGIAFPHRAARLAQSLLDESMFSGWGVRTVAVGQSRYNPMAYHNGSVWPHDNALIAHGLSLYGQQEATLKILSGLFDVSSYVDLRRMPELFCGFPKRPGEGPTLYPVACAPQAWAAGAVFLILQACLGISIDAPRRQLRIQRPRLPESIPVLTIRNLTIGDVQLDLLFERHPHDVGLSLLRRTGEVEVVVIK